MPALPSNTKLLLHMDGADASTTFTDDSGTSKSVTANGNAQIDTAQSKFGGASGLLDGTVDYLTTADHADFALGTGDFALSLWVRFNAKPGANAHMDIIGQGDPTSNNTGFRFYFFSSDGNDLQWNMTANAGPGVTIQVTQACNAVSTNTWYHFEIDRSGNNFFSFQDGVQLGSTVVDADNMPDATGNIVLFAYPDAAQRFLDGWADELIWVKGAALHTANFTPPTTPYGTSDAIATTGIRGYFEV